MNRQLKDPKNVFANYSSDIGLIARVFQDF